MLKIYFDDVLIDNDYYTYLDNDYKLFDDNTNFRLGATACNTFKLSVDKSVVSSHPNEVKIDDGTSTFYLIVDSIEEDKYVYNYTLVDKLMLFNFDYDASELIQEKKDNEEECYLSDIWHDMCDKADVEYDETYVFENDIVVNWYDNRIQARRYLSFIAELQSGYACILENGKQSFKKYKRASVKTIDADECSDLIIGEKKKITRVVYDGGTFKYEFGDDTGDTLYLQSDNVYIVNETIVENIYNNIKDFEFYIIDAPQAPMDSTVKAGDVITFNDNGKLYPTIAQYSMSYAGGWTGGYQLKVNTERQQETQITRTSQQVRNIQTKVDRLNNEFSVIAEEIEKLTDYIRNVGTTGNYLMLPDTPKSGGAINTLSIKGFELMPLYPGMAYPSEYTFPGVLNFYTLIFDTVNTFDNNPHYIYINSPVPLQKLGSVYDELLIERNKVKVIQRIGYDFDNEQWSVLSTPITHELNDVLLPTFEGDTYISVKYFDNLTYDAEYLIKNDLTSNFATQLESSSQFRINQNEISSKVNKDGIISEINQSAEQVKIAANKIKFEGVVTANENFKILQDGSIEAVNAKLTGDIFLPNGGRVIGGDGILGHLTASTHRTLLGYRQISYEGVGLYRGYIAIELYIPEMFTVVEAYITIQTFRTHNFFFYPESPGETDEYGKVQNIKLYKISNNIEVVVSTLFGAFDFDDPSGSEISGAFGADGYTSSTIDGETVTSADISNHLDKGFNMLVLKTSNAIPDQSSDAGVLQAAKETQVATATLSVIGYMRSDQE